MDDIQGSVLQGTLVGAVNGGAGIMPGKVGGALHLNGIDQNVNFGPHTSACHHTFQECPDGVTWAMWLKMEWLVTGAILDTGGSHSPSRGYVLWRTSTGLFFGAKNTTHHHGLSTKLLKLGYWVHLVFSLHPATNGVMYLNGCRVKDRGFRYRVSTIPVTGTYVRYFPFILGSTVFDRSNAAMDIDNLLIWYNILTPADVWKLYLQGGEFWFWKNSHMRKTMYVRPSI